MGTTILKSRERTAGLTIENYGFTANDASEGRALNLVIPRHRVPVVVQEHWSPLQLFCGADCFRALFHNPASKGSPAVVKKLMLTVANSDGGNFDWNRGSAFKPASLTASRKTVNSTRY